MDHIDFLSCSDVLFAHLDQIHLYGGDAGVRDLALLDSAVAQPAATFDGEWLHAFPYEMAAAYLFHLVVHVAGGDGRDVINASVAGIVDGSYLFEARGGRGADRISSFHRLATTHNRGSANPPPNITLLQHGGAGDDELIGWLFADGFDDDWMSAISDGGRGNDACTGNFRAINCEG